MDNVIKSLLKAFHFCLWVVFILLFSRFVFIWYFKNSLGAWDRSDLLLFLLRALQFDFRIGAICFLLFLGFASRSWFFLVIKAFTWVTLFLVVLDIGFFIEYKEQFNARIFDVFYDDLFAILKTMAGYGFLWQLLLLYLFLAFLSVFLLNQWKRWSLFIALKKPVLQYLFLAFLPIFFIAALRGGLGHRPLQRKDIAITKNPFLNKLILNPYFALYYAHKDYKLSMGTEGIEAFLPDKDIKKALKLLNPNVIGGYSVDDYFTKTVAGIKNAKQPAQHVFLIVMESQDAWPLMENYNDLNLMPNLKKLTQDALYFPAFLPSGLGTMASLNAIITGLPDSGVHTNYQKSALSPYSTSIAEQFKALGYQTHLFYGGYLSWQRLGDFAKDQGFQEVYGGSNMGAWKGNEWGVEDKALFEFVLNQVDPSVPSFNLIMTTSNHPRYLIDLAAQGCPIQEIPSSLKALYDGSVSVKILGHFWYADKCVGEFLASAKDKFEPFLVAITADHWSRHFLNGQPNLYEKNCVPFILYGPKVLEKKGAIREIAGCHLDIAPTLIHLLAPEGFEYISLGKNMLDSKHKTLSYGVGMNAYVTPEGVFSVDEKTEPFLKAKYNALHAVGWWKVMKGDKL